MDHSLQADFPVRPGGCGGLLTFLGLSILSSVGGNPGLNRILEVQIGINWKGLLIA